MQAWLYATTMLQSLPIAFRRDRTTDKQMLFPSGTFKANIRSPEICTSGLL